MDVFVGQLMLVAFNYAPQGFALCNGQLLPISQNTALFSLLGTYYGGNGSSTFALPNLQGSVAVGVGQGPGLSNYVTGQVGGVTNVTLLPSSLPAHTHTVAGTSATGSSQLPTSSMYAATPGARGHGTPYYATSNSSPAVLNVGSLTPAGGNQAHSNLMPYVAMNWIIALQGIFPQRQ